MPASAPGADGGHGGSLGEDLGVRADSDLEILAPGTLRHQHFLEAHGLGRAGLQLGQVVADERRDLLADRDGSGGVAAGALLDHPLQHGDGEGHARRLDRLEVDRGKQPGLGLVTAVGCGVGQDVGQRPDSFSARLSQRAGGVRHLAEVAHRRVTLGNVDHFD